MSYKLVTDPRDPVLNLPCTPVAGRELWAKVPALVKGMLKAMKEEKGLGLAANQVGVSLRVCVLYDHSVMVNPRIIRFIGHRVKVKEGCLSLPGQFFRVERCSEIEVGFQDATGHMHTETWSGLDAQIIQHELDHLNGRLICDTSPVW
jgi:peptide deformylase